MELPFVPSFHLPSLDQLLHLAKFIQDFPDTFFNTLSSPTVFAWISPSTGTEVLLAWFVDLVKNIQEQSSLDMLHALILPH